MSLKLTAEIVGPAELNRVARELNSLNDFFASAQSRRAGSSVTPPATTRVLDELAKANKFNLLETADRKKLDTQLQELQKKAPKLSIAFAVDPPPRVVQTILNWLRDNIDSSILLQVGLQPNIGAGCVIRTPSREFDLSMRQHLSDSSKDLALLIQQAASHLPAETPAPTAAAPRVATAQPAAPPSSAPTAGPQNPRPIPVNTAPPEAK